MDGLIELLFEGVPKRSLNLMIDRIISRGKILEFNHSDVGEMSGDSFLSLWDALGSSSDPVSISIRVSVAEIGDTHINNASIRIFRNDNSIDVSVLFDKSDIAEKHIENAIDALRLGSAEIASVIAVEDYLCGFDPAIDENTQFFHRNVKGPLSAL